MTPTDTIGPDVRLFMGDCLSVLPTLAAGSVDAVVTDPPYGLEFMGKEWDGADGFRRSLNPEDAKRDSAFGRTSRKAPEYRTAGTGKKGKPGIGDRDTEWVSNQGWNQFRCGGCGHLFHGGSPCECPEPKPVRADNRWKLFQSWCGAWAVELYRALKPGGYLVAFGGTRTYHRLTCAVEDAGFEIRDCLMWLYGSGFPKHKACLKPAYEPILLARKPGPKVLPLGIDVCRVATGEALSFGGSTPGGNFRDDAYQWGNERNTEQHPAGRWPANVAHDGSEEVVSMFPVVASGKASAGGHRRSQPNGFGTAGEGIYGGGKGLFTEAGPAGTLYGDSGSAARFYYCAKVSPEERGDNRHPTVKPLELMRWLCRLVTPKGGTVLDPFLGSGSTLVAAMLEGFGGVGIEREEAYYATALKRLRRAAGEGADQLFSITPGADQ